jgi:hypothetical protein
MTDTTKELKVDKLRVNEILVGPEDGEHMTLDPSALWLWRKDKAGPCAALHLIHGRPHFSFYDGNGRERVSLFIERDGSPNLFFRDGNGGARLSCYLANTGHARRDLSDGEEKTRLQLSLHEDESTPIVALRDTQGETLLEIVLDYQDKPSLMVPDRQGNRTPWLTAERKEG